MEFFDSKQEVIDIKLTQFGKKALARGLFKPVYYQFFDDDILYNSGYVNITEEQNTTEARILETPRLKTLHVNTGIETSFKEEQKLIDSGQLSAYHEITNNQDPKVSQKLLTYSLEKNEINSQEAPRFNLVLHGPRIRNSSDTLNVDDTLLPIPQLNITSSYTIIRDRRDKLSEVPKTIADSENYLELSDDEVVFLDKSKIVINRQDLIIDINEMGVDLGLENFEVEIYEIIEEEKTRKDGTKFIKENLQKLNNREQIKKYFEIRTDSMVPGKHGASSDGRHSPRGKGPGLYTKGNK